MKNKRYLFLLTGFLLTMCTTGTNTASLLTIEDYIETGYVDAVSVSTPFSKERGVPVFCGEFGVYMIQIPNADRVKWYKFVCDELNKRNISWTSWDYFGGFGIFKTDEKGDFKSELNVEVIKAMGFKTQA